MVLQSKPDWRKETFPVREDLFTRWAIQVAVGSMANEDVQAGALFGSIIGLRHGSLGERRD